MGGRCCPNPRIFLYVLAGGENGWQRTNEPRMQVDNEDSAIQSDSVRFCRIRSDSVRFCAILSDSIRLCPILSDSVRFGPILSFLLGNAYIWLHRELRHTPARQPFCLEMLTFGYPESSGTLQQGSLFAWKCLHLATQRAPAHSSKAAGGGGGASPTLKNPIPRPVKKPSKFTCQMVHFGPEIPFCVQRCF